MPITKNTAIEAAAQAFTSVRLPVPPIPGRFADALRVIEPWCFGRLERPLSSGDEAKAWWNAHRVGPVDYPPRQHRTDPEQLPTVAARQWVIETAPQRDGRSGARLPANVGSTSTA